MNRRILCVDDESNVLEGYRRALRKDFEISIAEGGVEAISLIEREEEFAVIISDMRMPIMDGVQFLRRVKEISPDTVRMMLTGNADQQTATDAVNEGSIFRFLTKPCPPENLANAIQAGLEQYRLITAEKVLLNETLNSSLQIMVDILSLVNPTAFSRSNRVKRLAGEIAAIIGVEKIWEIEIAAMLSQIGCVTVPEEALRKISNGQTINERELKAYHQHPQVGYDLISRIPRMDTIAQIIARQNSRFNDEIQGIEQTDQSDEVTAGSRILKAVLDFDRLLDTGNLPHQALKEMSSRIGWYDNTILEILRGLVQEAAEEFVTVEVNVGSLKPGMLLAEDVYSTRNVLLLSEKQEITLAIILKLTSLSEMGMISNKIQVSVPVGKFQIEGMALPPVSTLEIPVII
jgi:response regulator RpfG family c-di-GMP phosphodiesterase